MHSFEGRLIEMKAIRTTTSFRLSIHMLSSCVGLLHLARHRRTELIWLRIIGKQSRSSLSATDQRFYDLLRRRTASSTAVNERQDTLFWRSWLTHPVSACGQRIVGGQNKLKNSALGLVLRKPYLAVMLDKGGAGHCSCLGTAALRMRLDILCGTP